MGAYLDFWKRYFDFSGRSTRTQYFVPVIINYIILSLLSYNSITSVYKYAIEGGSYSLPTVGSVGMFGAIFALLTIIPSFAVLIRRLHDTDRSGFNILWNLIPVMGQIVLLIFLISRGTESSNRYGSNPKY